MGFDKQQSEVIALCKKLLENGTVETVIGFQEGGVEGMALPYIFSNPSDADKLVWNTRCMPNLSRYLIGRKEKIALIAKACDSRAVAALLVEKQLKRENVHIIGLTCAGMADLDGNTLTACLDCRVNSPPVYDTLIDCPDTKVNAADAKDSDDIKETRSGNFEHFEREIAKCILCFACRQACYGCYCHTCFMERGVPSWQPVNPDKGAKILFHAGRMMHLAGRCVECGACENACASGVNLRYVIRDVTNFVDELYDYRAGMDTETLPAMLTHESTDREVGFIGGDEHV